MSRSLLLLAASLVGLTATAVAAPTTPRYWWFIPTNDRVCNPATGLEPTFGYLPWTHVPECVPGPTTGEDSPVYCVFTNSHFAAGRGISVITTPEIATQIKAWPVFSYDDDEWKGLYAKLKGRDDLYEARQTSDRGMGLFAKTDIPAGEVILTDMPTLVIMKEAAEGVPRDDRQLLTWRGVLQLPKATRQLIRSLAKSKGGDEVDDLIHTNSIIHSYGNDTRHFGILPRIARINHHCRANSFYRFDETTLTFKVFALRNIEPGEEITFSYSPQNLIHEKRQEFLKQHWGFKCKCSACTASPQAIEESDDRVTEIEELRIELARIEDDIPRMTAVLTELLKLFDEEGIITPKARYYEIAAYVYNQQGDEVNSVRYALRALQHWAIVAGPSSWEVNRMSKLIKAPTAHPSWKAKDKAGDKK